MVFKFSIEDEHSYKKLYTKYIYCEEDGEEEFLNDKENQEVNELWNHVLVRRYIYNKNVPEYRSYWCTIKIGQPEFSLLFNMWNRIDPDEIETNI